METAEPSLIESANDAKNELPLQFTAPEQLSDSARVLAIALGLGPLILLAVALLLLSPDEKGLGTHQQLGLPPCSMRVVFGIRCPACGMTTSWSHFVRGQWWQSASANPGGFLLAIYSLAFALFALRTAKLGRLPSQSAQNTMMLTLIAVAVVAAVDWLFRLGVGGLFGNSV